jgi:hypothetical protein
MRAVTLRSAVTLIVSAIAGLALATSALGADTAPGLLTRADASPDWTRGSIAGFVRDVPGADYRVKHAWASIIPNSAVCEQSVGYPSGGEGLVWDSAGKQSPSFDIPELPLSSGAVPKLCLYGYLENIYYPSGRELVLASRLFTVPPAPVTPHTPPKAQPKTGPVTLSRTTAYAKARSALETRFGRAYRHGKRKRLSCEKRSAKRYRCAFSFRYRKKLRDGLVAVVREGDGSVSTRVKRHSA